MRRPNSTGEFRNGASDSCRARTRPARARAPRSQWFRTVRLLAAVARVVSETLGFATVVINLYRPESDEYEVKAVHGNERARAILLGNVTHADTWRPQLDPSFLRRGAFFIPEAAIEWDDEVTVYTPQIEPTDVDDGSAWLADDALFVTLDGTDGRRFGVIAVDEPESGRRPDDQLLELPDGGRRPRRAGDRELVPARPARGRARAPPRDDRNLARCRSGARPARADPRVQPGRRADLRLRQRRRDRVRVRRAADPGRGPSGAQARAPAGVRAARAEAV